MKKQILFFAIIISGTISLYGQKNNKEINGDKYYNIYSFDKAIEQYAEVQTLSIEALRRLAECYNKVGNYLKAEEAYFKLINMPGAIADDFFHYSAILEINGKYEELDKWMQKFKEMSPNDLRAKNYVANNSQLTNLLKDNGKYKIDHLIINTDQEDFGTAFYNDKIVFASTREGVKVIKRNYNWNHKPFLDMYIADTSNGELTNLSALNKKFNKNMHEGPANFCNDGKLMAFTRNNYETTSKDGITQLAIFFSSFKDGQWETEKPFELNNSEYSISHPCLTSDGNIMYFTSDMPGGYGGTDLYRIRKDTQGKWGLAENLGDQINTEGNEMFPYFEENSAFLFFASNGHLGIGGLDMFITTVKEKGYSKVLNLGAPLNSSYDDFALIIDHKMKGGYFSSNRIGGKGGDDIYAFKLLSPFTFGKTIKGTAKDKTGNILAGADIKLSDENGKEIASVTTAADGTFTFSVEENKNFILNGTKEKYFDGLSKISTFEKDDVITADMILETDSGLSLHFLVTDQTSHLALEGVKVKLINNLTGAEELLTVSTAGDFRKVLSENKLNDSISYTLMLEKDGYVSKNLTYNKVLDKEGMYNMNQDVDLSLDQISIGNDLETIINLKPIYFDLGKFNIRKDVAIELDKIVKIMNENPKMIIESSSYTDCRGTIADNEILSDKRANASTEYIKKKISNPDRISGKGYGESKFTNGCACEGAVKPTCIEAEHQMNRRTEFIIIKM